MAETEKSNSSSKKGIQMKSNIARLMTAIVSLGMVMESGYLAFAGCWTAHPQKCATINVTTCVKGMPDACPEITTCTASDDAYIYPAVDAGEDTGVDRTTGSPNCIFPAVYLDCDNLPQYTTCGPTGAYTTVDYDLGNVCN
jgi:hypothetical protein